MEASRDEKDPLRLLASPSLRDVDPAFSFNQSPARSLADGYAFDKGSLGGGEHFEYEYDPDSFQRHFELEGCSAPLMNL